MSQLKVNSIVDASGGSNAVLYGPASPAGSMGFRNRIINGDMVIDQRNAGASVTPTNGSYSLDRWKHEVSQASKFTVQQSTVAPDGFYNSMLVTSTSAYSVGASDYFDLFQWVEGFNWSDVMYGTATAKTVTLSFWVRSSLTGTFGGVLTNSAQNYSYPFTYSISSANTWEQKSITIAGPTAGTWLATTNRGVGVFFSLGMGSNFSGTAGSWSANQYYSATGATSVVGTNGATFYITGVQLEVGSVATEFERRPYGTELSLCQRYYFKSGVIQAAAFTTFGDQLVNSFVFYQPTRATPSVSVYSSNTNTVDKLYEFATASDVGGSVQNISVTSAQIRTSGYSPTVGRNYAGYVIVSSEL